MAAKSTRRKAAAKKKTTAKKSQKKAAAKKASAKGTARKAAAKKASDSPAAETPAAPPTPEPPRQSAAERLAERIVAYRAGSQRVPLSELYSASASVTGPGAEPAVGLAGIESRAEDLPLVSWNARHVLVTGDQIAIEWTGERELGPGAREVLEMTLYESRGGRILSERGYSGVAAPVAEEDEELDEETEEETEEVEEEEDGPPELDFESFEPEDDPDAIDPLDL